MINIVKWFTGLTFLLLQLEEKFIEMHSCKIEKNAEEKLVANCSHSVVAPDGNFIPFNLIPDDLDENIEVLDISDFPSNLLLENNALKRYTKLTELYMRHYIGNFSDEFFMPVPNLKVLDIRKVDFIGSSPKLPESITTLKATKLTPPLIDISHMKNLQHLYFGDNGLTSFPPLSSIAPLVTLDLSHNRELTLTLLDIATFCLLKYVDLSHTKIQDIIWRPTCCEIQFWLQDLNATIDFSCAVIGVQKVPDELLKCEPASNQEAEDRRRECEKRYQSLFSFELLVQILIVVGISASVCFLIFKYYRSRAVRAHRSEGTTNLSGIDDDDVDNDDGDDDEDE